MHLHEVSIKALGKFITGDSAMTPYRGGPALVELFNRYGSDDVYGGGFPSRWKYAEDKIRELNDTDAIRKLIEETFDPRRFANTEFSVEKAVEEMNQVLNFDNLALQKIGQQYRLSDASGIVVKPETASGIGHDFINQQIEKCNAKIASGDYNGAITNARTLIEAIFIEIIERAEGKEVKNDGDVEKLYKQVKKIMKLEIDKDKLPDFVIQILSGINTALSGFAGLSNNAGDRHANKFNTRKHHAKLAVNLALSIADFLLDSWKYQKEEKPV